MKGLLVLLIPVRVNTLRFKMLSDHFGFAVCQWLGYPGSQFTSCTFVIFHTHANLEKSEWVKINSQFVWVRMNFVVVITVPVLIFTQSFNAEWIPV